MSPLDVLAEVLLAGLVALPAAIAVALVGRRDRLWTVAGAVLVVAAGLIPLALGYGFGLGVLGGVTGGAAAAVWTGRSVAWQMRLGLAVAVIWLAVEPVVALNVWQVQSAEAFDRCAAGRAIAIAAAGQGAPGSIHDISVADNGYGTGCYVSNGVNWLYRVEAPGGFTIGYWVDWHVGRHVCIYRSQTKEWSCGLESWGPFRPGEID